MSIFDKLKCFEMVTMIQQILIAGAVATHQNHPSLFSQ